MTVPFRYLITISKKFLQVARWDEERAIVATSSFLPEAKIILKGGEISLAELSQAPAIINLTTNYFI